MGKLIVLIVAFVIALVLLYQPTPPVQIEKSMSDAMDRAIAESEAAHEVILKPNREMIDSQRAIELLAGEEPVIHQAAVKRAELGALMDRGKIPAKGHSHNFD